MAVLHQRLYRGKRYFRSGFPIVKRQKTSEQRSIGGLTQMALLSYPQELQDIVHTADCQKRSHSGRRRKPGRS